MEQREAGEGGMRASPREPTGACLQAADTIPLLCLKILGSKLIGGEGLETFQNVLRWPSVQIRCG